MTNRNTTLVVIALAILVSLTGGGLYSLELERKLPENTFFNQALLGNLNREEALPLIQEEISHLRQMKYHLMSTVGPSHTFTPEELGIQYHPEETLQLIFHNTGWLASLVRFQASAQGTEEMQHRVVVSFDEEQLEQTLGAALFRQEKDALDARIEWKDGEWGMSSSSEGVMLKEGEKERLMLTIQETSHGPFQMSHFLLVDYTSIDPRFTENELQPLFQKVQMVSEAPIQLQFDREEWALSFADSPEWFLINPADQVVRLNTDFAQHRIVEFTETHNIPPGQVTITSVQDEVSEYDGKSFKRAVYEGDFQKGRKANQEKMLEQLNSFFENPGLERSIVVEWKMLEPNIISQVEGYQFPQRLSTGMSSFRYGNHPNRVKNIKISLGSFKGVIVEPGEEFSFNRITGWVTPQKGYTKTQIINEGKVEDGIGGGVCQSSSTVYRSILNAGLPVTERRNHTLDVIYYHEFGYGLDATVYTDSRADLKFVNDFPGPILINTYTDDAQTLAVVDFYGITDHRAVELTMRINKYLLKVWDWKITWPDREEIRQVRSQYQEEKKNEEEKETNPLEA
ncbi:MAG: VanW family protein [bacterium]|nr:VanW family protein [bacterium]